MNFANAIDFNSLMEPVAARLAGEPNKRLSKPPRDVRFGTHGSLSIDYEAGQFYDHEANVGGGVCDLVKHKIGCDHAGAIAWLRQQGILPSEPRPKAEKPIATYDYANEVGQLLFQAVRFPPPDRFRQRRPDGNGGWIWDLKGVRRVLYRLPDLIKAVAAGSTIYLCEGEKDANNLIDLGFAATTNAGGAGKWLAEYNEFLRGSDVVLLKDNDEAGRKHVESVSLHLNGIARVRVLDIAQSWPECPNKGDISDWIAAGGTADKLRELVELFDGLPVRRIRNSQIRRGRSWSRRHSMGWPGRW